MACWSRALRGWRVFNFVSVPNLSHVQSRCPVGDRAARHLLFLRFPLRCPFDMDLKGSPNKYQPSVFLGPLKNTHTKRKPERCLARQTGIERDTTNPYLESYQLHLFGTYFLKPPLFWVAFPGTRREVEVTLSIQNYFGFSGSPRRTTNHHFTFIWGVPLPLSRT